MEKILLLALFCLLVFCQPGMVTPLKAAGEYGFQKVVYHFNTSNPQINNAGLVNIQNHLNAVGRENLKLVALVHSAAWEMVAKSKADPGQVNKMKALVEQGVVFEMCNNTLLGQKLDFQKDLVIPMKVVPAGVAELVKLQQEGYAYIKP
jgi:uncharacterized protein